VLNVARSGVSLAQCPASVQYIGVAVIISATLSEQGAAAPAFPACRAVRDGLGVSLFERRSTGLRSCDRRSGPVRGALRARLIEMG